MDYAPNNDPIRELIIEFIADRYEGVTFSDDFIDSIEAKVAPIIRQQTEETVVEFVADFFSAKKPTRRTRKPRKKAEESPAVNEAPSEPVAEEAPSTDSEEANQEPASLAL